jgi:hypothetical protein
MPKTVNGMEVMTSQEWMRLGYPVFVSAALEAINTDRAEDGCGIEHTPEVVSMLTTEDLMDDVLRWEGIVGFTSNIVESVRGLDKLKGAR